MARHGPNIKTKIKKMVTPSGELTSQWGLAGSSYAEEEDLL